MDGSAALIARRKAVVARGVGSFAGESTAVSASGAKLVDADGRELLDFAGGIGVLNLGHCNEQVVAAIREQAGKLIHACIHVATYEPYVELCEQLVELLPHGPSTKAMLVNSGAEAVENAVKIARQATGRDGVICFSGAFHGRTLLGMSLTSKTVYKTGCGPFAPEIYRLPYPDRFHNGGGLDEAAFSERELARMRQAFIDVVAPGQVAAVIIEPVLGEGGFIPAPAAYLRGLRALCDEYGMLLICDEVQSGFCRTGAWSAYEHAGIVPDLSTWAKSMGGGMPIAAVLGRSEVMDAAAPGTLGGTYGGNPVSCAAALATLRAMRELDLNTRARVFGERVRARFLRLVDEFDVVADVRGLGAMIALEFCEQRDPLRPVKAVTDAVVAHCRQNGLLILPCSPHGNVVRILAPLVIDDADLERGLDVIEAAVRAVTLQSRVIA